MRTNGNRSREEFQTRRNDTLESSIVYFSNVSFALYSYKFLDVASRTELRPIRPGMIRMIL